MLDAMNRGKLGQHAWLVDIHLRVDGRWHAHDDAISREFLKRWFGAAKAFAVNKLNARTNPPGGTWCATVTLGRYVGAPGHTASAGDATEEEWMPVDDDAGRKVTHTARLGDDSTVTWSIEEGHDA